jgi:hypothetical protein
MRKALKNMTEVLRTAGDEGAKNKMMAGNKI